jgi:hypothetical protein
MARASLERGQGEEKRPVSHAADKDILGTFSSLQDEGKCTAITVICGPTEFPLCDCIPNNKVKCWKADSQGSFRATFMRSRLTALTSKGDAQEWGNWEGTNAWLHGLVPSHQSPGHKCMFQGALCTSRKEAACPTLLHHHVSGGDNLPPRHSTPHAERRIENIKGICDPQWRT